MLTHTSNSECVEAQTAEFQPDEFQTHASDSVESVLPLNIEHINRALRKCPIRSSEKWRKEQRNRGMPSLPDIRHQISKFIVMVYLLRHFVDWYRRECVRLPCGEKFSEDFLKAILMKFIADYLAEQ